MRSRWRTHIPEAYGCTPTTVNFVGSSDIGLPFLVGCAIMVGLRQGRLGMAAFDEQLSEAPFHVVRLSDLIGR